ncbi:hypothetical protein MCEMSE15_00385 [Fimbriimonadaceae bacterium]
MRGFEWPGLALRGGRIVHSLKVLRRRKVNQKFLFELELRLAATRTHPGRVSYGTGFVAKASSPAFPNCGWTDSPTAEGTQLTGEECQRSSRAYSFSLVLRRSEPKF